jgi:luciferase family oxidoreductase group 1
MTDLAPLPLSVLDVAPVTEGATPADALQATRDLARHVDRLGFTRYWMAEHHSMPGIASSSPAVVLAALGAATERIRIGSGGVMLPNHPPLVVAEQFGTLEALYPGRVDLGIGRAPGTDGVTARALRRTAGPLSADEFPEQLGELLAFFEGEFPAGHPYQRVTAVPGSGASPPLWLLGSSGYSAQVAGMLGRPFAFAHHFSADSTLPALELYRSSFRPSKVLDRPYAMIAVQVVCAADDATAAWLAAPAALSFIRLRSGQPGRLPTPEEAAAHPWTEGEREWAAERQASQAVGGPETVRARLAELLAATRADELMVTTMIGDPAETRASMTRVRELFGDAPLPPGLDAVAQSGR